MSREGDALFDELTCQMEPLERAFSGELQRSESVARISHLADARTRRATMRAAAAADEVLEPMAQHVEPGLARVHHVVPGLGWEHYVEPGITKVQQGEPCLAKVQQGEPCLAKVQQGEPCLAKAQQGEPCLAKVQQVEPCLAKVQHPKAHDLMIFDMVQKISEAQQETALSIAWMAEQMRDSHRATQFLIKENALLRSRQAERQELAREMHLQQRAGLAGSIDALTNQVGHMVQQQAATLDALSVFSSSFDMPPPAAFVHKKKIQPENTYDEIISMMRQNSIYDEKT